MASTSGVSSSVIPEVLNRNNYKTWRSRIETYLLAEDLWEVVEATREPAGNLEDDEPEYKAWKRKNAKALYAIQNSCGQEMFQFISETKTAKFAWETLEKVSILGGRVENSAEYFEPYVQFTEFVREGDWDKAKECLKLKNLDLHSAVRAIDPRDKFGDTAVHVAARQGHVNIVKELMLLMTHEDLKMGNARGDTALHVAAANGQLQTVKELVLLMGEKRNNEGDTALHLAVQWEEVDVVKELVSFMRQTDLNIKNNNGDTALHLAVKKRNVAMMKYLAALIGEVRGPDGDTALHLAVKLGAAKVVKELVALMKEEDLAIKNDEGYTALHLAVKKGIVPVVKELMTKEKERDFDSYIEFTTNVIKGEWDNAKECLTKLDEPCDAITIVDPRDGYGDTALHSAAKQGHVHIVKELISLLKVRPEIQELQTIEDIAAFGSGINLGVTEEVVRKNAKYMVEHLMYGISEEDQRLYELLLTKYPENMLHFAVKLSPPLSRFNRIRGAALQMQRELQWFKAVEDIVPLHMREVPNSDGMTPHELFTKNHEALKKEAEDSMKGTATSCTVVGALIVTMMFAAAFTVPGGNDGSTGVPMFLAKNLFLVFIISDTLSLVSSTTSVILFLGILTSRYAEDDFLKHLPTKMMLGLSTLFISIFTMMVAFSSALIMMLDKQYSWAVIPSIFAASIPVASFIWLQFPLLIEIIWSTYGPGIFDKKLKKGKPWIKL
ncbi:hypothetical protein ACLB2K_050937 [Fragaria x ananassa]